MATIAVLHIGLGGHLRPLSRLGRALAAQGHRVIAWAPDSHRPEVERNGVIFETHEPMPRKDIYGGLAGFAANLARATDRCTADLIEQLFAMDVDLVVHDCHAPWGLVAAEFLGLPRVVSDPLFPVLDARAAAAAANGDAGPEHDAPAIVDVRAEHYPGGLNGALSNLEESRRSIARRWGVEIGGFYSVLRCGGPVTVSYTTPDILGEMAPEAGWWFLGPLMEPAPPRVATGRPLIYVALGTFYNYSHAAFMAAIKALADEPVDVLVSTGRGYVSPSDLEPRPDNVEVHEFVDSRAVLARAAVHVTHCGGSSMHESLLAGVPMVCIPQGSDQFMWAQRTSALGAGVVVPTAPTDIRGAVRRLLTDEGPRRVARQLGGQLAAQHGESELTALLGSLLGQEAGPRGVSSSSARGRSSLPSDTGTS